MFPSLIQEALVLFTRRLPSTAPPRQGFTRLTRRLAILCGTVTLVAGLAVSQAPAAMAADSLTPLGHVAVTSDIAAAAGKVFVALDDRIVVADTQGVVTGNITGLAEVRDLVTNPDGTRLYAALRGSHEVIEINTDDLAILRRIGLGAYQCPSRLAMSGHRLWVSHGCPWNSSGGALGLDLSVPAPQPSVVPAGNLAQAPRIAAAGSTLVVADFWDLRVYDLQDGVPALRGAIDAYDHGLSNGWGQIALTSDGATAITTPGAVNDFDAWDLTTLTKSRSYGKEEGTLGYGSPTISPDGKQVAVTRGTDDVEDAPLVLFDLNTGAAVETFDQSLVAIYDLVFSGSDLFAVIENTIDGTFHLWRMHGASLPPCKMTLTGPDTSGRFKKTTFTGRLTRPDGTNPGVQTVTVSRRPWGESNFEPLPDVTTNADGTFTFSNVPGVETQWTYKAYYDNTADSRSCSATKVVEVSGW
ncbi:hypothetical protein HD597_002013 [Nonomuraea thailandensis]|uniref:40-residue YVTN family beta-propeller repeat-containing protein n=1 Tax=Nonomuraea thailandensis TaxID=1188745 RepID=A0A9X2GHT5_9ACTN|nr:hypothetical protein [Nonomuraea thailandensis]MCP2354993.1 hypothetical protein [Nonomuraea thailandensis]